jgi:RHS repeat-associated protein
MLDPETGVYCDGARWYDAGVGRFLSDDPTGFSAGDTNLQRYVFNDPVNAVDPTGEVYAPSSGVPFPRTPAWNSTIYPYNGPGFGYYFLPWHNGSDSAWWGVGKGLGWGMAVVGGGWLAIIYATGPVAVVAATGAGGAASNPEWQNLAQETAQLSAQLASLEGRWTVVVEQLQDSLLQSEVNALMREGLAIEQQMENLEGQIVINNQLLGR